jgi:hypothetical protein
LRGILLFPEVLFVLGRTQGVIAPGWKAGLDWTWIWLEFILGIGALPDPVSCQPPVVQVALDCPKLLRAIIRIKTKSSVFFIKVDFGLQKIRGIKG